MHGCPCQSRTRRMTMNDINKMPPKCQYCPYWEICRPPYVCPDIGDKKSDLQPTCNQLTTDAISRRLAIDKFAAYIYHAFKDFYRIGLHRKTLTPEQCRRVARDVLAEVSSAQPETADCIYCHEDSDGYVKPIEKNCHAFIRFGMNGWEISLSAKGWNGSAKIMYCPMCGRRLNE